MKMIQTEILNLITKKTLGLTLVLSSAAIAFAQEKQQISGKIVDAQNNAVPYASISFSNKTVKENAALFSDATLTDEKGNFTINLIPGNYEITIDAVDFKKLVVTKSIGQNPNLGNIKIESEQQVTNAKTKDIEGVTLTSTAKPYKVELDKRTYDVSADITTKGGNLQDVLQNVPSVSVETDGTVSMRGNSNVRFLINGKPSSMLGIDDNANALQSIPADQIEKIEVITNPSSKFESAGTAGILNIILKKTKKTGFNGSVEGTLGYLPTTRLNTNLSWRKGNLTYYLNGGVSYNEGKFTSRNDYALNTNVISPIAGTLLDSHQESETNNYNKSYNVNTGLSYDITPKTTISSSIMLRGSNSNNESDTDYDENIYDGNTSVLQQTNRNSDGKGENLSFQADAGLDHKIDDKGQLISFAASFQTSNNDSSSDIKETTSNNTSSNDISVQNSKNRTILLKADYELPIGEKSKIEAGARYDANKNDYDYEVTRSINGGTAAILPLYTSLTTYDEKISAAYTQFKSKISDKISYQLGLRVENTNIDLSFDRADGLNKQVPKDYTNVFPTVFLSYDISKNNQFLLNYTERIRRPRSFFLIPFMSLNNNRNLFEGNPDLNPSLVHSYEFGYSLQKNKFSITPTLYYRNTVDDIKMYQERTLDANNNTVITTKPINLGTEQTYGLDLNASVDITKWWKVMGNLDLFGYKTEGKFQGIDYSGDGFSSRVRLTNTFRPDKNTSFQIQSFFRGGQKTASNEQKAMYAVSLGANRTIWKGNGTLSFNVQDIFNTRARETAFTTETYTNSSYMQMMPRTFTVSLSYRFKQGEKVDSQKRKKDINNNDNGGDDQMPPM